MIEVYNEYKKYVVNTIIMMVFPPIKFVLRFRLSFNQILSPGLQLTPGFSSIECLECYHVVLCIECLECYHVITSILIDSTSYFVV